MGILLLPSCTSVPNIIFWHSTVSEQPHGQNRLTKIALSSTQSARLNFDTPTRQLPQRKNGNETGKASINDRYSASRWNFVLQLKKEIQRTCILHSVCLRLNTCRPRYRKSKSSSSLSSSSLPPSERCICSVCGSSSLHLSPSSPFWLQSSDKNVYSSTNPFTADPVKAFTLCHTGLTRCF